MRTLVIECATEACSVALFEDGSLVAGTFEVIGRGHAERLVPMIAELPGRGRAARVAVSLGPGSFTGVRVGLAAARALALAWDAQIAGFPTLTLLAAMARRQAGEVPLALVMTGGHGEWFVQHFAADGQALGEVASLRPDAAAAACAEVHVAGSQAEALVTMRGSGKALALLPDARSFDLLAPASTHSRIAPLYGRAPDARLPQASR